MSSSIEQKQPAHNSAKWCNISCTCSENDWPSTTPRTFKRKIIKNIVALCMVSLTLNCGFCGLLNIQSSLHHVQGLGVVCLGISSVCTILSSFFLATLMISKFGHKRVIAIGIVGQALWIAANGYATWVTMTIVSAICGLASAPYWTAMSAYISLSTRALAKRQGCDPSAKLAVYFGAFALMVKTGKFPFYITV